MATNPYLTTIECGAGVLRMRPGVLHQLGLRRPSPVFDEAMA